MSEKKHYRTIGSFGASHVSTVESAGAGLLIVASVMFAQSLVSRPKFDEFEVASIKPTPPGAG
jgi:hypothetical protein